jgi:transcription antitermination factor NusG
MARKLHRKYVLVVVLEGSDDRNEGRRFQRTSIDFKRLRGGTVSHRAELHMVPLSSRANEQNGNEPWHAVHTRYRHEKVVDELLTREGFETFLPLYMVVHRWKDRTKKLSVPLFPNYVFVRGVGGHTLRILKTPGVCSIVGSVGRPGVLPDSEIAAIRQVVDNSLPVEPHPFLTSGDWVRIQAGPLAGLEGILVRTQNRIRFLLSLETLGRSVAVEIENGSRQMRIPSTKSSANTFIFEYLAGPGNSPHERPARVGTAKSR